MCRFRAITISEVTPCSRHARPCEVIMEDRLEPIHRRRKAGFGRGTGLELFPQPAKLDGLVVWKQVEDKWPAEEVHS